MGEITRATTSDADWAAAAAPGDHHDAGRSGKAGDPLRTVNALSRIAEDVRRLDRYAAGAADVMLQALKGPEVLAMVALVQDQRRALAEVEAILARQVGRDGSTPFEGTLPDGRAYKLRKGADRKAWDHAAWQRDVRAQVMSGLDDVSLVNVETGEPANLKELVQPLLEGVQRAHGSAAPKTTALKPLGLSADDYCETVPGPWSVAVMRPGD